MALIFTFGGSSDLLVSPATNNVYAQCGTTLLVGTMTTNTPGGEVINSLTLNGTTITIDNVLFDDLTPTFPYTVNFGVGNGFNIQFDIVGTGIVGNTDTVEFVFNMQGGATYSFQYDITEIDLQDSVTIPNNTLPLDFGSVDVGNFSDVVFVFNNETCKRYDISIYSDGEITFNGGNPAISISPFPRTTVNISARWEPTSAYDLSAYQIFADIECGQAVYPLLGISTEPPVSAAFSNKLIIANSISI